MLMTMACALVAGVTGPPCPVPRAAFSRDPMATSQDRIHLLKEFHLQVVGVQVVRVVLEDPLSVEYEQNQSLWIDLFVI